MSLPLPTSQPTLESRPLGRMAGLVAGNVLGARDGLSVIPDNWWQCVSQEDRILQTGRQLLQWSGLSSGQENP